MKKVIYFIVAVLLLFTCTGCGSTVTGQTNPTKEIAEAAKGLKGYTVVKKPIVSNPKNPEMGSAYHFNSLDEYESIFFDVKYKPSSDAEPAARMSHRYIIVKGKKINSQSLIKDMGEYEAKGLGNEKIKIHDVRKITLTQIEITQVYKQEVLDGAQEYKKGDKIIVVEKFNFNDGNEKGSKNQLGIELYKAPLKNNDEYIFYATLPKEPLGFGSEHFGYDTLDNVFEFTAFSLDGKQQIDPNLKYLHQDILNKYINK